MLRLGQFQSVAVSARQKLKSGTAGFDGDFGVANEISLTRWCGMTRKTEQNDKKMSRAEDIEREVKEETKEYTHKTETFV